jgi:hypothetical protein
MTLDAFDQAFVDRWRSRTAADVHAPSAAVDVTAEPAAADMRSGSSDVAVPVDSEDLAPHPCPVPGAAAVPAPIASTEAATAIELSTVARRLLASAAAQWHGLADEVEAARLAGHRVIAITGGEPGEGRTTLVACLATVLVDRGRDVTICDATDLATCGDGVVGGGQLHDKRIVLVDAGIWFPPGPIRRGRLVVASLGCDAAILVRRADRDSAPAWATALAAVGVEPLGEVVTFAPTHVPSQEAAA